MDIIVVGSVALDTIETPFGRCERILGGSATHFSCAASFFAEVGLVGVVGDDFPEEHVSFLRSRGVNLAGLEIARGETFHWEGYYEYDMNQARSRKTCLNVFETFQPDLPDDYRHTRFLFLANIDPDLQLAVLDQMTGVDFAAADTMNFWIESKPDRLREVLGRVNAAFMNDAEARELCGTYSLVDAARTIMSWGPELVVFKKGEHGAVMFSGDHFFAAPGFPLEEVRDPTGAGDSFAGGFMGHLARSGHLDPEEHRRAVVYGSVLASFNVEGFGTERIRTVTKSDIDSRYTAFRSITRFD